MRTYQPVGQDGSPCECGREDFEHPLACPQPAPPRAGEVLLVLTLVVLTVVIGIWGGWVLRGRVDQMPVAPGVTSGAR